MMDYKAKQALEDKSSAACLSSLFGNILCLPLNHQPKSSVFPVSA